jgi:hypothetical protein
MVVMALAAVAVATNLSSASYFFPRELRLCGAASRFDTAVVQLTSRRMNVFALRMALEVDA